MSLVDLQNIHDLWYIKWELQYQNMSYLKFEIHNEIEKGVGTRVEHWNYAS